MYEYSRCLYEGVETANVNIYLCWMGNDNKSLVFSKRNGVKWVMTDFCATILYEIKFSLLLAR